jgi:hypothetical protein
MPTTTLLVWHGRFCDTIPPRGKNATFLCFVRPLIRFEPIKPTHPRSSCCYTKCGGSTFIKIGLRRCPFANCLFAKKTHKKKRFFVPTRLSGPNTAPGASLFIRDGLKFDVDVIISDCPARFNYGGLLLPHTQLQLDPALPHLFLVLAPKEPDRKFRSDLLPTQVMNVNPTGMVSRSQLHVEVTPAKAFVWCSLPLEILVCPS